MTKSTHTIVIAGSLLLLAVFAVAADRGAVPSGPSRETPSSPASTVSGDLRPPASIVPSRRGSSDLGWSAERQKRLMVEIEKAEADYQAVKRRMFENPADDWRTFLRDSGSLRQVEIACAAGMKERPELVVHLLLARIGGGTPSTEAGLHCLRLLAVALRPDLYSRDPSFVGRIAALVIDHVDPEVRGLWRLEFGECEQFIHRHVIAGLRAGRIPVEDAAVLALAEPDRPAWPNLALALIRGSKSARSAWRDRRPLTSSDPRLPADPEDAPTIRGLREAAAGLTFPEFARFLSAIVADKIISPSELVRSRRHEIRSLVKAHPGADELGPELLALITGLRNSDQSTASDLAALMHPEKRAEIDRLLDETIGAGHPAPQQPVEPRGPRR